ncbi:MAG: RtcB family protein [Spirochaetaceae bacterium]
MYEIHSQRIPIKLWLDTIEEGALKQAQNIADLPWAFGHIAIMPDAHEGFGMPIGGVLATEEVVIPNAVGVDIGCGMIAVQTDIEDFAPGELDPLSRAIRKEIPAGFSHHKTAQPWEGFSGAPDIPVVQRELESARRQIGTLGGGNHFIELQKGDDGHVWIMLHSGSRNFGYTIAKEFGKSARSEAEKKGLDLPDTQLAPLFLDTEEGRNYFEAMEYAQRFAAASRARMVEKVQEILERYRPEAGYLETVNIHHNFAALEVHYGKEVVIHRKGATAARRGQKGIIPGSQGTSSYIVEGLGNPESFESCSHGAGRVMGRKAAQRNLDLKEEQARLDRKGIYHNLRTTKDLDEAAGAYKEIDTVMAAQTDLVRPLVKLEPLAVIKG